MREPRSRHTTGRLTEDPSDTINLATDQFIKVASRASPDSATYSKAAKPTVRAGRIAIQYTETKSLASLPFTQVPAPTKPSPRILPARNRKRRTLHGGFRPVLPPMGPNTAWPLMAPFFAGRSAQMTFRRSATRKQRRTTAINPEAETGYFQTRCDLPWGFRPQQSSSCVAQTLHVPAPGGRQVVSRSGLEAAAETWAADAAGAAGYLRGERRLVFLV